ncbi:MAG: hypothetical protein ACOYNL_08020 [Rickettsiales bacterium]
MNVMLLAGFMLLTIAATPAFACKVQFGIGARAKRIANIQQRLAEHQKINRKQRTLYADYQRDSKAYEIAMKRGWPVGSETGGTDCFPNCSAVSEKELAGAPHVRDGIRYRVSEAEAVKVEETKRNLMEKWNH